MGDDLERAQELRAQELRAKEKALKVAMDSVKETSVIFERIVNNLVDDYCYDLDLYVRAIGRILEDIRKGKVKRYSDLRLDLRALELATKMYEATNGIAVLGSQSDVAKAKRKNRFDTIYAGLKGPGTIPDKTAEANSLLIEELMIESITERALKVVSQKIKNANRLLEAIKKVLTAQIVSQEVWRKEAHLYDIIDAEDGDLETEVSSEEVGE